MRVREENLGVVEVSIDGTVVDILREVGEEGEEGGEGGIEETVTIFMKDMTIDLHHMGILDNMMNMKKSLLIMT